MNKCLYCGKPLKEDEVDWHQRCIKSFFGTKTLPSIDIKDFSAIFLDQQNKEAIITGVQKKYHCTYKMKEKIAA
jgi:serine/threonine-protein kinase HipA